MITLDPQSALPIYRQVADQIRRGIAAGRLRPGDPLPSVRELSAELVVNPNTIVRVYRDLAAEGLIEVRRAQGTYVAAGAAALAEAERRRLLSAMLAEVARDVRAFGVPAGEAVQLFERQLADEPEDRGMGT